MHLACGMACELFITGFRNKLLCSFVSLSCQWKQKHIFSQMKTLYTATSL